MVSFVVILLYNSGFDHCISDVIDAASNRKLLHRLLMSRDVLCDEACDGVEAVEKVQANPDCYDFIIMDNTMPNMVRRNAVSACTEYNLI